MSVQSALLVRTILPFWGVFLEAGSAEWCGCDGTVGDHRKVRGSNKFDYKPLGEGPVKFSRGAIFFQSGNAHKVQGSRLFQSRNAHQVQRSRFFQSRNAHKVQRSRFFESRNAHQVQRSIFFSVGECA